MQVERRTGKVRRPETDVLPLSHATNCVCVCVDAWFRRWLPSRVCAACVAAARNCLRISPTWLTRLHHRTGYAWTDLQPLVSLMLQLVASLTSVQCLLALPATAPSMKWYAVHPSVCPSMGPQQQTWRKRYLLIAVAAVGECGQCRIVSVRR